MDTKFHLTNFALALLGAVNLGAQEAPGTEDQSVGVRLILMVW
jgi:hypothetical protein